MVLQIELNNVPLCEDGRYVYSPHLEQRYLCH